MPGRAGLMQTLPEVFLLLLSQVTTPSMELVPCTSNSSCVTRLPQGELSEDVYFSLDPLSPLPSLTNLIACDLAACGSTHRPEDHLKQRRRGKRGERRRGGEKREERMWAGGSVGGLPSGPLDSAQAPHWVQGTPVSIPLSYHDPRLVLHSLAGVRSWAL